MKIGTKKPVGPLGLLEKSMISDPLEQHLVIAVVDCMTIALDTATDKQEATLRLVAIEPVLRQDSELVRAAARRARDKRTGAQPLIPDPDDVDVWDAEVVDGPGSALVRA